MLPPNFWNHLKTETNRYARYQTQKALAKGPLPPNGLLAKWTPVTLAELKGFFSITIHMGLVKLPRIRDYWSTNPVLATTFCSGIMSRNRFLAISSMLHLSDSTQFVSRGNPGHDPLFKLRPFLDPLIQSFQSACTPGRQLSLDEAMCPFRGRIYFRVYNSNKPDRWGIKLYQLCDSVTGYTVMVEVYTGSGGTTVETVMRLMTNYLDQGHTLFMDRYYNSLPLTEQLLTHDTQVVGTIQTNRRGLPEPISKQKLKKDEVIAFRKGRIMALKWRDKREVTMISTLHDTSMLPVQRRGEEEPVDKPVCVIDYNKYMGGVDHSDQLMSYYPFKRKALKWYKKLFYRLFYLAITNCYIIYRRQRKDYPDMTDLTLSQFLQRICADLRTESGLDQPPVTRPSQTDRLTGRHFPEKVKATLCKKYPDRRCVVCSSHENRKHSRYQCSICNVGLCVTPCFQIYHTQTNYYLYLFSI